ncbi:MAG: LemA family protein [Rhodococcus sp. (in: high G+C Gram-positive bacteria)]|uniref:LemA family protein n=1 Tax=Rhodococcus sp. SBT000017 TaxID=1803385 RepID=UPI00217E77E7|nr:LemA family protein [Rhodococcus sp. SBT000017]
MTVSSSVVVAVLVLVLFVVVGYVVIALRRLGRYSEQTEQSLRLVDVELDRRHEQLGPFLAAAEATGLSGDLLRQLGGARSWSKAVRDRRLGLQAQAAAENALSAAFHAVLADADARQNALGNWAFRGPAGELDVTERRIAGAVRVYNDNAYRLSQAIGTFPSSLVARSRSLTAPEPFVETKELLDEQQSAEIAA